jgi:hypothetical protein
MDPLPLDLFMIDYLCMFDRSDNSKNMIFNRKCCVIPIFGPDPNEATKRPTRGPT